MSKRALSGALVALAVAAGLGAGLFYTWIVDPIETGSSPDSLYIGDKLVYLTVIGDLYAYEGDLEEAQARLALLDVRADGPTLASLIEQYLDGGGAPEDVRNLARLAQDLGASGGVLLVFGPPPTPTTVVPTVTPTLNPLVSPTPLPTATPLPAFRLVERTALCAEPQQPGRIRVWVMDRAGAEMAGVEVSVSWAEGQDHFFTGLRPEMGLGYGDFEMQPRVVYDVTLAGVDAETAQGLSAALGARTCPSGTVALDWRLIFQESP